MTGTALAKQVGLHHPVVDRQCIGAVEDIQEPIQQLIACEAPPRP